MKRIIGLLILCAGLNSAYSFADFVKTTTPAPVRSLEDCLKEWASTKKNEQGLGFAVVGGFVGVRWLPKDKFIDNCMNNPLVNMK